MMRKPGSLLGWNDEVSSEESNSSESTALSRLVMLAFINRTISVHPLSKRFREADDFYEKLLGDVNIF